MGHPVEVAAVYNGAAYAGAVAVHIFGGRMGNNVRAPLKGTAVDRGGKGVVHNQRHPMGVGHLGKQLNIQHRQSRIGNGLAEHSLGVGPEGGIQFLLRGSRG